MYITNRDKGHPVTPSTTEAPSALLHLTQRLADLHLVQHLVLLVEQLLHRAAHRLRDLIHVLRFDDGLEVVLEDLGEVVLQLRAAEVRQNVRPVGRVLSAPAIGQNPAILQTRSIMRVA